MLPSGKMNLSLSTVTSTLTGYGAWERTETGIGAVREVKVIVPRSANETRPSSASKCWV